MAGPAKGEAKVATVDVPRALRVRFGGFGYVPSPLGSLRLLREPAPPPARLFLGLAALVPAVCPLTIEEPSSIADISSSASRSLSLAAGRRAREEERLIASASSCV